MRRYWNEYSNRFFHYFVTVSWIGGKTESFGIFKMSLQSDEISLVFKAFRFAAEKHIDHRKKDQKSSPYINHPIKVADTLWNIGEVRDVITIVSAILHDTLEHTDTTSEELDLNFGSDVSSVVKEVSDDMSLPEQVRKQLQIEHAPQLSDRAKLIKLADKICNIDDKIHSPPKNWSFKRRKDYLDWTKNVVDNLQMKNSKLTLYYEMLLKQGYEKLKTNSESK